MTFFFYQTQQRLIIAKRRAQLAGKEAYLRGELLGHNPEELYAQDWERGYRATQDAQQSLLAFQSGLVLPRSSLDFG